MIVFGSGAGGSGSSDNSVPTYATAAALPALASDGDLGVVLNTDSLYQYNSGTTTWILIGKPQWAASEVSFSPTGSLSATDVQSAIAEAASESIRTLAAFGASPNANGLTVSGGALNMQPADATNPGGVSTAAQVFGGEKRALDGLHVGSSSALGTSELFKVTSTTKGSLPNPVMTTTQRDAIATPTSGMHIFNSTTLRDDFYDGTRWQGTPSFNIAAAQTPADAATPTILGFRRQVVPVSGSGGAATLADLGAANAKDGDELVLIGTSDTNTVTVVSATNTLLNGDCTLGLDDMLELVFYSTKWRERSRSN